MPSADTPIDNDVLLDSVILLVDDTRFNLQLLEEIMRVRGFTCIITAMNGQEALDQYHEHKPDLVVLDLMMPVMNGYEFCKIIRNDIGDKDCPILVQTALTSLKERQAAFDAGATDLVSKPVNPDELVSRVKVHLSMRSMMKDLSRYREEMQQEMDSARDMQMGLLPSDDAVHGLSESYSLELSHHFEPSIEIGGDLWGAFPLDDARFAFYITDFSGHGVTAAINTFRFHTILMRYNLLHEPAQTLQYLNSELAEMLPTGQFATMLYAVVNVQENVMDCATAAAPTMFIKRNNGVEAIESQGFALGVVKDATYNVARYSFKPHDALLCYSDALTETSNKEGQFFDESLLEQYLRDVPYDIVNKQAGHDLHQAIMVAFSPYLRDRPAPDDDMTLLVLRRKA